MTLHGQCLCGAVEVEVDDSKNPVDVAACSLVSILDSADVKITGATKDYEDTNTASGKSLVRTFCPNCGSPLGSTSPNYAGKLLLNYGVFAQQHAGKYPKPVNEIFCKNRSAWETPVEGAAQAETVPQH
ncbi:hypothetical protein ACQY0O_000718 [Thecaphora frezii]